MLRRAVLVALMVCAGCVARWQTVPSFADELALPAGYVGSSHRVLRDGDRLLVEIDQVPGVKVAIIEAQVRSDGLYLFPLHASVGSGGTSVVAVDLAAQKLPADWFEKTWWVTSVEPPRRVRANVSGH
jgi:hypothetical protein